MLPAPLSLSLSWYDSWVHALPSSFSTLVPHFVSECVLLHAVLHQRLGLTNKKDEGWMFVWLRVMTCHFSFSRNAAMRRQSWMTSANTSMTADTNGGCTMQTDSQHLRVPLESIVCDRTYAYLRNRRLCAEVMGGLRSRPGSPRSCREKHFIGIQILARKCVVDLSTSETWLKQHFQSTGPLGADSDEWCFQCTQTPHRTQGFQRFLGTALSQWHALKFISAAPRLPIKFTDSFVVLWKVIEQFNSGIEKSLRLLHCATVHTPWPKWLPIKFWGIKPVTGNFSHIRIMALREKNADGKKLPYSKSLHQK